MHECVTPCVKEKNRVVGFNVNLRISCYETFVQIILGLKDFRQVHSIKMCVVNHIDGRDFENFHAFVYSETPVSKSQIHY